MCKGEMFQIQFMPYVITSLLTCVDQSFAVKHSGATVYRTVSCLTSIFKFDLSIQNDNPLAAREESVEVGELGHDDSYTNFFH